LKRTGRRAADYINKEVVQTGLNNKQQTVGLRHQHANTIQLNLSVGLGHQHDTTLTADTECLNNTCNDNPTREHTKLLRVIVVKQGCRASNNSDFPKQPTCEPNEKQTDSPKRKVSTSHCCRAQGTEQLRLPILTLRPASGFCPTFETFWTTKKRSSPHVIVAEPHPLT
jgi:hypothetical protein